jgi:hypothetical protein
MSTVVQAFVDQLCAPGIDAHGEVVSATDHDLVSVILQRAMELDVDLLVLGHQHHRVRVAAAAAHSTTPSPQPSPAPEGEALGFACGRGSKKRRSHTTLVVAEHDHGT